MEDDLQQVKRWQGYWIDADIALMFEEDQIISIKEMLLLSMIAALNKRDEKKRPCTATDSYFGKRLRTKRAQIQAMMKHLKELGLIRSTYNGSTRNLYYVPNEVMSRCRERAKRKNTMSGKSDMHVLKTRHGMSGKSDRYNKHDRKENSNVVFDKTTSHNGSSSMPFFEQPSIEDFDVKISKQIRTHAVSKGWLHGRDYKPKNQAKEISLLRKKVSQEDIQLVVDHYCSNNCGKFKLRSPKELRSQWDKWELLKHAQENKPVEISKEAKVLRSRLFSSIWRSFNEEELLAAIQVSLDRYQQFLNKVKKRKDEFSQRAYKVLNSPETFIVNWFEEKAEWLNSLVDKGTPFKGKVGALAFDPKKSGFNNRCSELLDAKSWSKMVKEIIE